MENNYYEDLVMLSQYINGLQHLFEGMEDGPMRTVEPIELVRLLEPVTTRLEKILKLTA
tara:strand:+ start:13964 stop:14140 length:177 start_codon:yes stop_codon:yes gene_type:complete